jgi:hypothetical protein
MDKGIKGIRNRWIHRRTADQRLRSIGCQPGNATEGFGLGPSLRHSAPEVCVELDCLPIGLPDLAGVMGRDSRRRS